MNVGRALCPVLPCLKEGIDFVWERCCPVPQRRENSLLYRWGDNSRKFAQINLTKITLMSQWFPHIFSIHFPTIPCLRSTNRFLLFSFFFSNLSSFVKIAYKPPCLSAPVGFSRFFPRSFLCHVKIFIWNKI